MPKSTDQRIAEIAKLRAEQEEQSAARERADRAEQRDKDARRSAVRDALGPVLQAMEAKTADISARLSASGLKLRFMQKEPQSSYLSEITVTLSFDRLGRGGQPVEADLIITVDPSGRCVARAPKTGSSRLNLEPFDISDAVVETFEFVLLEWTEFVVREHGADL